MRIQKPINYHEEQGKFSKVCTGGYGGGISIPSLEYPDGLDAYEFSIHSKKPGYIHNIS